MENQKTALAYKLADDAARSYIESYCKLAAPTDAKSTSHWYDIRESSEFCEEELATYVPLAIKYLSMMGKIEVHAQRPQWIRIHLSPNAESRKYTELKHQRPAVTQW